MFCQDYGSGPGGGDERDPFMPQIVISSRDMLERQRALFTVLAFLNGCTPRQVVSDFLTEILA